MPPKKNILTLLKDREYGDNFAIRNYYKDKILKNDSANIIKRAIFNYNTNKALTAYQNMPPAQYNQLPIGGRQRGGIPFV